jgi:DNA primase
MNTKRVTREDIVKQVSIESIANYFDIALEPVSAGNFDFRCKCPSDSHKSGKESTPSLYINKVKNDFFCYGCNEGSSVIDFYMMCARKDFRESFSDLSSWVEDPGKYGKNSSPKKSELSILLENSSIIRNFLIKNPDKLDNITGLLTKLDKAIFEDHKDDPEYIAKLNNKLQVKMGS